MNVAQAETDVIQERPARNVRTQVGGKPAISVIGLGYVGAVSIACLSKLGFRMLGVDVASARVDAIRAGRSPIVEDRLEELLSDGVENGLVDATDDLVAAVLDTQVTFISVGTPTSADGSCDLTYVRQASRAIGRAIAMKDSFHVVVLRCSVPPGTTLDVVAKDIEDASGERLGEGFGVCFNPEFLREGMAVVDFFAPPKTVIGASDRQTRDIVSRIYHDIDKNVIISSIAAAEMVKYVDNVWHANKVAFGNEVGRLCKSLDIDSHEVMDIFVKDLKLNLSPYYLKPGFAFGGSCLPKEVRAVSHLAQDHGVQLPLVESLMASNRTHIAEAIKCLEPFAGKRFGFLGITFKPGTDDLRESPVLDVMASLIAAGETVRAYDPNLHFGPHLQSQMDYIRHAQPHQVRVIDALETMTIDDADTLVAASDVVVVAHATDEFRAAVERRAQHVHVLDLARLFADQPTEETYEGVAW